MAKDNKQDQPDNAAPEETALAQPASGPAFGNMIQPSSSVGTELLRDETGAIVGVEIENDKLEIPRLALIQKQSAVTDQGLAKAGDLMSTLEMSVIWPLPIHDTPPRDEAGNILPAFAPFLIPGSNPPRLGIPFLPVKVFDDRVMFNEDFSLACRSIQGGRRTVQGFRSPAWTEGDEWDPTLCSNCPLKDWKQDGGPPECSLVYNVIGFALNLHGTNMDAIMGIPMAASFSNTSARTGRQVATLIKASGRNPWGFLWTLWTSVQTGPKGTYYVWNARQAHLPDGQAISPSPEMAERAVTTYQSIEARGAEIERTSAASLEAEPVPETPLADDPNKDPWEDQGK